jgi:hypothetical protein
MSAVDNLDLKAYKRILKKYNKNPEVDVCHLMATEMESPRGCGLTFLYCCCFCCIHSMLSRHIVKRSQAIDDLFAKKYPSKSMNELMTLLQQALDIVEKHTMKLYDIRNRLEDHLKIKYNGLTNEELSILMQSIHLLNPVVYVI